MAYGKIDWSTWTKAAMAQTIDTLMARQTELLNRIAELERRHYVAEGIGRQQSCDACRTPDDCDGSCQHKPEDALGGGVLTLPWRVGTFKQELRDAAGNSIDVLTQPEPVTHTVAERFTGETKIDWSKL